MDTTQLVATITALAVALGGPLTFFVKSSLDRFDKMADRLVGAVDRQVLVSEQVAVRIARIESRLGIETPANASVPTPPLGVPSR